MILRAFVAGISVLGLLACSGRSRRARRKDDDERSAAHRHRDANKRTTQRTKCRVIRRGHCLLALRPHPLHGLKRRAQTMIQIRRAASFRKKSTPIAMFAKLSFISHMFRKQRIGTRYERQRLLP